MSEVFDSNLSRVKESYRRLSAIASNLNSASDRLGSSIVPLEFAIRKLGLDIPGWVVFNEWHSEDHLEYHVEEIGYTSIGRTWGLAIRTRAGREPARDEWESQTWAFNEAPRAMRARSIQKIPDLLEQLVQDATRVEADIVSQVETVEALGGAILTSTQDIQTIATAVSATIEVSEPPVRYAAPPTEVSEAPVRYSAQSDSAAAAAKVRRFLQLKDLSD